MVGWNPCRFLGRRFVSFHLFSRRRNKSYKNHLKVQLRFILAAELPPIITLICIIPELLIGRGAGVAFRPSRISDAFRKECSRRSTKGEMAAL